jgi:hypothetical protein
LTTALNYGVIADDGEGAAGEFVHIVNGIEHVSLPLQGS